MESSKGRTKRIKIINGDESVNIFITNNVLKKAVLREYFPEGIFLRYEIEGEKYLLDTSADSIFINTDTYNLTVPKGRYYLLICD